MTIKRVWIAEGCISCSLCMDIAPDVFEVPEGEDCVIRPDAAKFFASRKNDIRMAAEDCPVEVIQLDENEPENPSSD